MASEDDFTALRKYFTDDEWKGLSDYMKTPCSNVRENYELMLKLASLETSSSRSFYPRRQREEVNYIECEENSDEEHLFCDVCGGDHPGDCHKHGPLTHVKHAEVDAGDPLRANKTLPEGLSIGRSTFKGAQYGMFTLKLQPKRVYFGPYEGVKVEDNGRANGYTWQVRRTQDAFRTIKAVV
ncbi:histone-lysine N-methyltransferase PRDM7-like [Amblyomma americanum]